MALTQIPIELSSTPGIVDNSNATAITIDSSENVGIGSSSPSQKLDVSGNISMSGAGTGSRYVGLLSETNTYAGSLIMQAGGSSAAFGGSVIAYGHSHASKAGDIVDGISSGSGGSFRVNTSGIDGGTDVLVVEAGGNVNIGTSSKASATTLKVENASGYAPTLEFNQSGVGAASIAVPASSNALQFNYFDGSGLTEAMRISGGNLLLGDTGQLSASKFLVSFNGTDYNGLVSKTTRTAVNSNFAVFLNSSNAVAGTITHNGTTTVNYVTSSDQRLKENIVDAPSASADIDAIQVRSFDWKADGEHEKYGFIAQELNSIVPEAVSEMGMPNEEDPMLGVDSSKLVPMLVKEIQSLRARVAQLENN